MDLIAADMIQTIEVSKALTPDMDADAIGGSVNLVTRAAPAGQRIAVTDFVKPLLLRVVSGSKFGCTGAQQETYGATHTMIVIMAL